MTGRPWTHTPRSRSHRYRRAKIAAATEKAAVVAGCLAAETGKTCCRDDLGGVGDGAFAHVRPVRLGCRNRIRKMVWLVLSFDGLQLRCIGSSLMTERLMLLGVGPPAKLRQPLATSVKRHWGCIFT